MKKFFLILLISVVLSGPKMKSLLVPGWGEFSLDKQSRGKFFLCAESVLIISAFSFNDLSNSYKTDYTAYAAQHANVDLSNEDYLFALDVGNNDNIYDFNNLKRRQRSLLMDVDNQGNIIR